MIAISTAYKKALIGVLIGGKMGFKELPSNCKHSENILPAIDEVLSKVDATLSENDCYALVIGPGSFTGIRIGISLVKGFMAGGGQKKLVTITTNELMAYTYIKNSHPDGDFVTVIDALSNQYFVSKFSSQGRKLEEERLVGREEQENMTGKKVCLSEENIEGIDILVDPTAQDLLELAEIKYKSNEFVQPQQLSPLYLRKSQAEDNLISKQKN